MITDRNPVGWFEIYVQDIDRAKAFYQKTFQLTLDHLETNPEANLKDLFATELRRDRSICG